MTDAGYIDTKVKPVSRVVAITMFLALWAIVLTSFGGVLYLFDHFYVSDRDEEICALVSSQSAVVAQLVDDLVDTGQPVSQELIVVVGELRAVEADCDA